MAFPIDARYAQVYTISVWVRYLTWWSASRRCAVSPRTLSHPAGNLQVLKQRCFCDFWSLGTLGGNRRQHRTHHLSLKNTLDTYWYICGEKTWYTWNYLRSFSSSAYFNELFNLVPDLNLNLPSRWQYFSCKW